jgi:hypothetical protein
MSIFQIDLGLAVLGILLSGLTMAILLVSLRSFGTYAERIKQSNALTRRSNERLWHELERTQEENLYILKHVMQLKEDLERSA